MLSSVANTKLQVLLVQTIRYSYVGRKCVEEVTYTRQASADFTNILGTSLQSSNQSYHANRQLVSCLFSRIIGSNFPLSIYLSQQVHFLSDVPLGTPVRGEVQVVKDLGRNRYEIKTQCLDHSGKVLVDGKAVILQE